MSLGDTQSDFKAWFLLLILMALTALVYHTGLSGPLLFDDGPALTGNDHLVFDGSHFDNWRIASLSSHSGPLLRPIAMFSFAANVVANDGVDSFSIKSVNLLIHLFCGGLVFVFASQVFARISATDHPAWRNHVAVMAAALWLLAPLHVSTVLYAVQRMAQLSALFSLAGLVIYMHYRSRWAAAGASAGEFSAMLLWLFLFTFLGALSKENGVLLLWLVVVVEVTLFNGDWSGVRSVLLRRLSMLLLVAPVILVLAAMMIWPDVISGRYAGREFTLEERLWTQLRLLWRYLGWLIFPDINAMGFQHDDIPISRGWMQPLTTLVSALALLVALSIAIFLRHRVPLLLFALLFYLIGHSLESSVWPLEMVYEHRNYLPSVAVFIFAASVISLLYEKVTIVRSWVPLFAVLAVLLTLLFLRVFTWGDQHRLASVNVANHPVSSRSHYFLAESWMDAYREFREASDQEHVVGQYLVLARNHFELMYQLYPRDVAAIVMLYYLDTNHFSDLLAYNDWFSRLEDVLTDKPLQASDYSALDVLMDCYEAGACDPSPERLERQISLLQERYPRSAQVALMHYRFIRVNGASPLQRVKILKDVIEFSPNNDMVYQYLILEQADLGDLPGLYKTLKDWMAVDLLRQHIGLVKRIVETPVILGHESSLENGIHE